MCGEIGHHAHVHVVIPIHAFVVGSCGGASARVILINTPYDTQLSSQVFKAWDCRYSVDGQGSSYYIYIMSFN